MSAATATATNAKKVVMCRFALLGCPVPNCGYAHKAEELSPIMCKHGNRCMFDRRRPNLSADKRPCGMFHPGEDISSEAVYKRALEYAKPFDLKELLVKTSVCQFSSCKNEACTYAHSAEDIKIPYCVFGKYCPGYGKCRFEHNRHLTKQEYYEKRCRSQRILPAEMTKGLFVIRASEDSDDDDEDTGVSLSLSQLMKMTDDFCGPKPPRKVPAKSEPVAVPVVPVAPVPSTAEEKKVEEEEEIVLKPIDPNVVHWSDEKIELGQALYPLIAAKFPKHAPKMTGMILDLDVAELKRLLQDPALLNGRMIEALSVMV